MNSTYTLYSVSGSKPATVTLPSAPGFGTTTGGRLEAGEVTTISLVTSSRDLGSLLYWSEIDAAVTASTDTMGASGAPFIDWKAHMAQAVSMG